ncbi:TRAP transporter small permease [Halocella sp. SP3-1]|uniref:TRAP transporter small permease n=1 Tax=Halocella sp. SP3-1 TaxID=2382161 RepID=UPI000F75401E|nr:TRAP transporter small permease [Halocella sp. SP3-1]AZO93718.1 TRAP transporter small permease [Halocella sp. SP3-1]
MNKKEKNQGALVKGLDFSEKMISYIAMLFLVIMILIVSTTVFTRYVFNYTFRWSDEVALLMMIWFGFIGLALGVKNSIHLSIEYFMSLIPDKYQKYIYQLENVLVAFFGWFMLKYGYQLYMRTKATRLPATQWSRGLLFIMLPISGALVLLYSLGKMFNFIKQKETKTAAVAKDEDDKGGN